MGHIDPGELTESGECCLARLVELASLPIPTPHVFAPIATAVEVHVSATLAVLVELSQVKLTPIGAELLNSVERDMSRSWPDRLRWLSKGFEIVIAGDSPTQIFLTLVHVRNSMVHGDGNLSADQRAMPLAKQTQMKKDMHRHLGVTVDGQLRFTPHSRQRAFAIARKFVSHFDRHVIDRYPAVRGR